MVETLNELGSTEALEPVEREVLARLWERVCAQEESKVEEGRAHLMLALARLDKLWEAIELQPSVLRGQTIGCRTRDLRTLIDVLASCSPFSAEAFLPTRAALCRALLTAKLNFCRMLGVLARELLAEDEELPLLSKEIERIQTSAVCDVMAEDLLRMITSDETLTRDLRRRATRVLVQMWEYRACEVVHHLFPVLDSAWQAKTHITIDYGYLCGVAELLTLLSEGCDPLFIDCFSRDDVAECEELALQEFVFNVPYEQLQKIQRHMERNGPTALDASAVASILQIPQTQLRVRTSTCEDMIYTFRERQALASHRQAFDLEGPKRTAEGHLMIFLLRQKDDIDIIACDT